MLKLVNKNVKQDICPVSEYHPTRHLSSTKEERDCSGDRADTTPPRRPREHHDVAAPPLGAEQQWPDRPAVVFVPKMLNPQSNHEKSSDKPKVKHILQNNPLVILETVKKRVMKEWDPVTDGKKRERAAVNAAEEPGPARGREHESW